MNAPNTGTALTTRPDREPAMSAVKMTVMGAGGMVAPETLGEVVEFAKVMSRAQEAIPKHLRDNPGACMAVTMMALRLEMDPFAVASKSYKVGDTIAYEAQLIAAAINTRAPLKDRPKISFQGEGQGRICVVTATFRGEAEPTVHESPKFSAITPKNSPLWKSDPDQQQAYYTIRAFGRRHCPEVILGMYDREEMDGSEPMRTVTPATVERPNLQARLQQHAAPAIAAPAATADTQPVNEDAGASTADVGTTDAEVEDLPLKTGAQLLAEKQAAADPQQDQPAGEGDEPEGDILETWLPEARRYINDAMRSVDLPALWQQWLADGHIKRLSAADKASAKDLQDDVQARRSELAAEEARAAG